MVFDNASDLYIPCDFSLGTGRNEKIYCESIKQLIHSSLNTAEDTLNQFRAYIKHKWMVRFPPSLWNISAGMIN
ncbi:hypothetical protein HZS_4053 [Henneguya salminicola]|nr:hypothetical protein HZS_4053 [Henneguya salminicola]